MERGETGGVTGAGEEFEPRLHERHASPYYDVEADADDGLIVLEVDEPADDVDFASGSVHDLQDGFVDYEGGVQEFEYYY